MFTRLLCSFPIGCTSIGLAHQSNIPIRPLLFTKPINDRLDAYLFTKAFYILTVCRFSSSKCACLGKSIAMWNKGVVHPLSNTSIRNCVWIRIITYAWHTFATKVVVRMDGHDNRDLCTIFYRIWKPQSNMHFCFVRISSVLFRRW